MGERLQTNQLENKETLIRHCGYCPDGSLALHEIKTIDVQTEWICGYHKRQFDLTGLATNGNLDRTKPTAGDKSLAAYIRDHLRPSPVEEGELFTRLQSLRAGYSNVHQLKTSRARTEQIYLVEGFNTAIKDGARLITDADDAMGFVVKLKSLKLAYDGLKAVEDPYARMDRALLIMAYNAGLGVLEEFMTRGV